MKVSKEDECILWVGKPDPVVFKYRTYRSMTKEISEWLQQTFKGFGTDYYYSHGEIWFRKGKHETMFLLRWS